jgi:arylsulfatase A-like enzyme
MDPCWADPLKDHPVTQSWPDEVTIEQHQSVEGSFTARRQFPDGKSPVRLMPDAVTSRRDFEHMIIGYDAAIRYVDHHVKIVLDELDRQGVLDDAIVIFTADHGDAFGEHGIYSDHVCADECIHHIPLIVRWPGLTTPGSRCDDLLYNVDLSATLSELLAGSVPSEWDGMSFAPQLRGERGPERDYLVWDHGLYTVQRAVRTKQHLMVRTYHPFEYSFEPVELYDLVEDRFQTRNLSHSEPDTVRRCQALLDEWTEQQRARHGTLVDPVESILAERQS